LIWQRRDGAAADTHVGPLRTERLPAETARRSTITQIYDGTNQIRRVVMARQMLK
jgi:alkylation response protein AidB-like acyl-CoA dehydrogenase